MQILLENIYKKYSNTEKFAVTNFNLVIKEGEFIVLVGPSGCGKTTMLRMIAGLESISIGQLVMDNRIVNELEPKERKLAMVFQDYALYPHMTVFNNMAFSLKLQKMNKKEIQKKVEATSQMLGLTEYLYRKPSALSGGQKQRVVLGRAIVREEKLFLMDEPLSNLDAKLRVVMRSEIAKLHSRLHTTTIYVTHDQTEAMTLADRIVIMKDGFIQQVGTPKEVYNEPNNMFVASFMGSPGMNFFKVKLMNDGLRGSEFTLPLPDKIYQLLSEKGYEGNELILGFRPEDVSDDSNDLVQSFQAMINAKITVVELLGAEIMLHVQVDATEFVAKVSIENNYHVGENIKLWINLDKVSFFDKETESRISDEKCFNIG